MIFIGQFFYGVGKMITIKFLSTLKIFNQQLISDIQTNTNELLCMKYSLIIQQVMIGNSVSR